MATMKGSTAASSANGGWKVYADYSVTTTDTNVQVVISEAGMCSVSANVGFDWDNIDLVLQLTVGSNTYRYDGSYYDGHDAESPSGWWYTYEMFLCTNYTTYPPRTWTFNYPRGKSDETKTISVSQRLPGQWYLERAGSYDSRKSIANTTSSGSISVSVPALASYIVSLDVNGGAGDTSATKWHGEALVLPQPVKAGYAFTGWALSTAPATVIYQPGDSYTANAAASLVAVWTPVISGVFIESLTAVRADSEGEPAEDGEYAIIECAWRVEGAKAASVAVSATLDTTPTWTVTDTESKQAGADLRGTSTWFVAGGRVNAANRYTAAVTVAADGMSASMTEAIGIAFITIDVKAGGRGIAFGKAAETDNLFEVGNMDVSFGSDLNVEGDTVIGGDASASGDITSAGTVNGAAIRSAGALYMYNTLLANCFSCAQVQTNIGAVSGSSTKTLTIDATRADCRPIAISGWYVYGAATLHPYMLRLNGNNVECYLRNNLTTATSSTAVLYVQVLYIRTGGSSAIPTYDGPTTVIPRVYEQMLDTDGKQMLDDVTVEVIPVARVSNESGGETATIGE